MLLGLDDTDTRSGGCTTHTALRIAAAITRAGGALAGWGLTDAPRLVRLNPAAPHRTRGNGAMVLPIGPAAEDAEPRIIGRSEGIPLHVREARPDPHRRVQEGAPGDAVVAALAELVADHLPAPGHGEHDPQPGAVLMPRAPVPSLYAAAVARIVRPADAWAAAPPGTERLTAEARRGEIGALAAAAWPAGRWSWEGIAYRDPDQQDAERALPPHFATQVRTLPGGFDNHEATQDRLRCVPRTPCPVRWGLRGTEPTAILHLAEQDSVPDHWLVRTNHASADHARHAGHRPRPHAVVRGTFQVTAAPRRTAGGHLLVPARDGGRTPCTLAAFEPTKALRHALEPARPGDVVAVLGRSGPDARTVAVEAFAFCHAPPRRVKTHNPRCPGCTRAMKSIGQDAGYRCRACGTRARAGSAPHITHPGPSIGRTHQVPDHVRGHLLPPPTGAGTPRELDGRSGPAIEPLHLAARPPRGAGKAAPAVDGPTSRPRRPLATHGV